MKEPVIRFQDILEAVRGYIPEADTALLRKAYVFAAVAHRGQLRKSGIPYLSHPLAVTKTLTDLRMDVPTLCGGLLHDVLEDCEVEEAVLKDQVGEEVTRLVVGLTKTSKVSLQTTKRRRLESYRKTLIAMSRDIRILMIKLSDRLHNMRTLFSLSDEQRKRISEETLTIYAPLANRLGISWMRSELEDLSFQHLNPELYEEIRQGVEQKVEEKAEVIQQVTDILEERFREEDIPCEISGRVKHYYSIHRKMIQQEIDLDQIFDLFRLAGHRGGREALLPGAWRHPFPVGARAGQVQGLHRQAEGEPVPVPAHDGVRAVRGMRGDTDPQPWHAPGSGIRRGIPLDLQGAGRLRPGR